MNDAGRRATVAGGGLLLMVANIVMGGAAGKGDSDMAAYLSPPPANLTAKGTQSKTDAQLRKVILEGRPGTAMTGYEGAFEEPQLSDLIAYIRSLKS